jgi:hypothetical protein
MLETRARAEEAKFALDHDAAFKAHARRDRMFGRWAAHLLGLRGEAAEGYALELMRDDAESAGDDRVLLRVGDDLRSAGVAAAVFCEDRLRRKLERLAAIAASQPESAA